MNLNDLLGRHCIDPKQVIVLRHRPTEKGLNKILPWLVAERPDLFDAYQGFQSPKVEKAMSSLDGGYLASFLARGPGAALFVGLFKIGQPDSYTYGEYWALRKNQELRSYGMRGYQEDDPRPTIMGFSLSRVDFYTRWIGRMVVGWPPPELSWYRRAHKNEFPILSISEDSQLVPSVPNWDQISLTWEELAALPTRWRDALSHWRGIYFIFDEDRGKGYVGSAYGNDNIHGRWLTYDKTGHGGNVLLKESEPRSLKFTILQRVSPDMSPEDVIAVENSWKARLHTRQPYGLNAN